MKPDFQIIGITAEGLLPVYQWYRAGQGTYFLVDPHNKSLFISYEGIVRYFERKFFVYEYFILQKGKEQGLLRMLPDSNNLGILFDVWLEKFSAEILWHLAEFLKNHWLVQRCFHKIETRVIFEKEYLEIYKKAGFRTESIMREEVFYNGKYFDVETLACRANHA